MNGKCPNWKNSENYCKRGGGPQLGCYPKLMEKWEIGGLARYEECPIYNGNALSDGLIDPRLGMLQERPKRCVW